MAKYLELEIDNSAASAIKTGKWNAPGAAFYDQLLNSFHYGGKIPEDAEELNKCIREGKYRTWVHYLEEAYLIAPVKKIHNSPHGVTPFSRSGCKYPHHVIKGNKLVLSVPGIKAAYARALQMGVLKGDVKRHLERHIKELGLEVSFKSGALSWNEACETQIGGNFHDIYCTIMEHTGINLFESEEYFTEASHGKLKVDHRLATIVRPEELKYHDVHIIYSLDGIKFTRNFINDDTTDKEIQILKKLGNTDHESYNQKVLAIIDLRTGQHLDEVWVKGPTSASSYSSGMRVAVGEVETKPTFKSTFWKMPKNGDPRETISAVQGMRVRGMRGKRAAELPVASHSANHARHEIDNSQEEIKRLTKWIKELEDADPVKYAKDISEYREELNAHRRRVEKHTAELQSANKELRSWRPHTESSTNLILVDPDDTERVKHMQEEGYVWADWKNRGRMQPMVLSEAVIEGSPDNPVLTSDFNDEAGEITAEALWNWMHDNIQYDKSLGDWKLRTAAELYIDKKGNCHDQAYFAAFILNSWGYDARQLFFVEFDDDSDIGGNSHTLCYFRKREPDAVWYWFENAWEDQAGIHGPFENVEEVKQAVMKTYEEDDDINSHKFDGIVFGSASNYRLGMNLHDYVDSWTLDDDRRFIDMNKDPIQEAMELLDWITEAATNKDHQETMSDVLKKCNTPQELLNWMDCIEYGWIDKAGNKNGTGENDDTSKMWAEYKLQSPLQLIRSKVGVCWDQCELERVWFQRHKYPFTIVYLEIDDDEAKPSHSFLVYKEPGESSEVYWFEHSWGQKKGIHKFSDFETCMQTVIQQFEISQGKKHGQNPVYKHMIIPAPKYGINVIKYMEYAHKCREIDLGDIQYDDIFGESVSFTEASHGKLKQDHRIVYDIATGHECHIIYDTENIKFDTKTYKAHNLMGRVEAPTKSNFLKKGNLDHLSYNQKVLAIIDMKTKQRLNEIDCIGVFQVQYPEITRLYGKVNEFKAFAKKEGLQVLHVKVGEIETTPTYKSTFFPKQSTINRYPGIPPVEMIRAVEGQKRGRSGKLNDLDLSTGQFRHPKKGDNRTREEEDLVRTAQHLRNQIKLDRRILADAEKDLQQSIDDGDDEYLVGEAKKDVEEKRRMLQNSTDEYRKCNEAISKIRKQRDDVKTESSTGATSYQDLIDRKLVDHPSYSPPKPVEELPEHLKEDPIHPWRARTGIELIHREPTLAELDRIWRNWNLMSAEHQEISDQKSIEFFGMDNPVHYHYLRPQYATQTNSPYFINPIMTEDVEPPSMEDSTTTSTPEEEPRQEESKPKKVDRIESPKNGVRRKKLYIAFIEWCKGYNDKNAFGSIFDEDAFKVSYPFVPEEMRYFYRLANPMLCVLSGDMTFFPVAELRKLNAQNSDISNQLIFAATPNDVRVFNCRDKKVYRGTYENGALKLNEVLSDTFDTYIQNMIKKGDILTAPLEDE